MSGHRRPPLSTLLTAAAFGAVAGHALTYMVAIPDPVTRQLLLAATGHGYLPAVVETLGFLQCAIFLAQETVERVAVGAPSGTLFHDHVFPIGLLVQLGVAVVVTLVLFALGRTVEAVAAALSRRAAAPREGRAFAPTPMSGLRSRLVAVAGSIRAPPAIASFSLV